MRNSRDHPAFIREMRIRENVTLGESEYEKKHPASPSAGNTGERLYSKIELMGCHQVAAVWQEGKQCHQELSNSDRLTRESSEC